MSGILHSDADVTTWTSRLASGYNPGGIFDYTATPSEEVITKANKLLNDEVDELWNWPDFSVTTGLDTYTYRKGHYIVACAFYYMCGGGTQYGTKAKTAILAQVNLGNPDWTLYTSNSGNQFHFASFAVRMMLAYDYSKDLFNATETQQVIDWLDDQYSFWLTSSSSKSLSMFPNRATRDYSVLAGDALTPRLYNSVDAWREYTYKDYTGAYHNRIYYLHRNFENALAMMNMFVAFYGAIKNDDDIIDNAVIWVEEWLKYSVFPDHTSGECYRNGAYGRPMQGTMSYEVLILECNLLVAEIQRRRGSAGLYELSTSVGLQGSDGGPKTIRGFIQDKIDRGTTLPSSPDSQRRYGAVSTDETLSDSNLLDCLAGTLRMKYEDTLSIANRYYDDIEIENTYLLNNAVYDYNYPSLNPTYNTDSQWVGAAGVLPSVPLMYYEMESGAPISNAGTNQNITTQTSTLDGSGSSDQDGTIATYLWQQVSGPNTANIVTPSGVSSIINGLTTGDYVFRLTVTDNGGLTDTDTVTITVTLSTTTSNANSRILL